MLNQPRDGDQFAHDLVTDLAAQRAPLKKSYLLKLVQDARARGQNILTINEQIFCSVLLQVYDQGENSNPGVINVNKNVINANGPVTGVAQGDNAVVLANDITVFNQGVDSSSADAKLKTALKEARAAIETWHPSDADERAAVLSQFDQFASEAVKEKPNKHLLKTLWGGISSAVSSVASLTAFLKAGSTIMSYFGIGAPIAS